MTIARAHLVDPTVSRWYHCVTRCVRRAFLLGEGQHDRRLWIETRLQDLAEIFAIAVGGFSILDNHLHLLVRLDPEAVAGWSDEDVARLHRLSLNDPWSFHPGLEAECFILVPRRRPWRNRLSPPPRRW